MRKRNKIAIGVAALVLAGGATGGSLAIASSSDEDDQSVTGPAADTARAAALAATGPGSVAGTVEKDSEDGATWEVEVTKADGSQVDVRLDGEYKVVVIESDSESPDDDDSGE